MSNNDKGGNKMTGADASRIQSTQVNSFDATIERRNTDEMEGYWWQRHELGRVCRQGSECCRH